MPNFIDKELPGIQLHGAHVLCDLDFMLGLGTFYSWRERNPMSWPYQSWKPMPELPVEPSPGVMQSINFR